MLIYQTLLGAWPLREDEVPWIRRPSEAVPHQSRARSQGLQHLAQAGRRARAGAASFCGGHHDALADATAFLRISWNFRRRPHFFGALNSLSQTLLLITAPGIPDFYQNTTFWDLSLVDPDNRRAIELDTRLQIADEIAGWAASGMLGELLREWPDGRVKVLLIYCALQFRRAFPDLFVEGEYIPLHAEGKLRENVVAFARKRGDDACITVIPRFATRVAGVGRFPLGSKVWRDTRLVLTDELRGEWKNVITGAPLKSLAMADIFAEFPVALLAPPMIGSSSGLRRFQ
jgi:(1->4)-alpha-D-glucan 1-alpha-D-glucosylmutase